MDYYNIIIIIIVWFADYVTMWHCSGELTYGLKSASLLKRKKRIKVKSSYSLSLILQKRKNKCSSVEGGLATPLLKSLVFFIQFQCFIYFSLCLRQKAQKFIMYLLAFVFLLSMCGKRANNSVSGATSREIMASASPETKAFPCSWSSRLYANRAWSCWLWQAIPGTFSP